MLFSTSSPTQVPQLLTERVLQQRSKLTPLSKCQAKMTGCAGWLGDACEMENALWKIDQQGAQLDLEPFDGLQLQRSRST